jgi:hypothetical protein
MCLPIPVAASVSEFGAHGAGENMSLRMFRPLKPSIAENTNPMILIRMLVIQK